MQKLDDKTTIKNAFEAGTITSLEYLDKGDGRSYMTKNSDMFVFEGPDKESGKQIRKEFQTFDDAFDMFIKSGDKNNLVINVADKSGDDIRLIRIQ